MPLEVVQNIYLHIDCDCSCRWNNAGVLSLGCGHTEDILSLSFIVKQSVGCYNTISRNVECGRVTAQELVRDLVNNIGIKGLKETRTSIVVKEQVPSSNRTSNIITGEVF